LLKSRLSSGIKRLGDFMKGIVRAIVGCAVLLVSIGSGYAQTGSDRDMANRYLQAARSGDDQAQFYLGALYSAGVGLPRSDEDAFRWFAQAADQGHSHAMLILGGLYAVGRGVQKDNVKAYQYAYIVSSATRVEEFKNGSRQLMGVLEGKMTSDEVSRARAEASRWRPTSVSPPARIPPAANAAPNAAPLQPVPALPAPQPAASQPQAPARADSSGLSDGSAGAGGRKSDIDGLIDQVPQGLRKKFGF
jgi:hypothetical protein